MPNQVLWSGSIFRLERRAYRRSTGGSVERDVVVHPGAVTVVPILGDDRIVMIRNRRFAVERELLELPAGTLEAGESPLACAARELEEETGYRAARITPLCEFYTTPGICTERMYVFVARDLVPTEQNLKDGEEIRVCVHRMDEVRCMLSHGELSDGKTIAALGTLFVQRDESD